MAARGFDLANYRVAQKLQEKGNLVREERSLLELLLVLIERFEEARYGTKKSAPHEILRELMRAKCIRPKDLYEVFGSRGTTSEVLRGKRGISKTAAKVLGEIFHVSPSLFI